MITRHVRDHQARDAAGCGGQVLALGKAKGAAEARREAAAATEAAARQAAEDRRELAAMLEQCAEARAATLQHRSDIQADITRQMQKQVCHHVRNANGSCALRKQCADCSVN